MREDDVGRGRASESKKRKEMRRGRNVVNRHEKRGPSEQVPKRMDGGPLRVRLRKT